MPDVRGGLLGPAQVVDITRGLLHSPDLLVQLGLLAPRGGSPSAGVSQSLLPKPLTEYAIKRAPSTKLAPQSIFNPEQFYNARKGSMIVPWLGDKLAAGYRTTEIEGKPVEVELPGGGGYTRTPGGGVWANQPGAGHALTRQIEDARRLSETGKVYGTHVTMSPTSGDFQHATTNAFLGLLKDAPISRAGAAAVKERMAKGLTESTRQGSVRYTYEDFPGINSPKLAEWLNKSGRRRAHFMQLMDSKKMQALGVPEVAAARLAVTDIPQLGVPPYASGMHIAEAFPGMIEPSGHPSFLVGQPGRYEGSFGKYIPLQNMFPDAWSRLKGMQNPGRALQSQGAGRAAQIVNQRWLDQIMPAYERLPFIP